MTRMTGITRMCGMTRLQGGGVVPFFEQKIQGHFFKDTFLKDSNQRLESMTFNVLLEKRFVVFPFLQK